MRALLVEDSAEFVTLVRAVLEQSGFAVTVAGDGATALTLARSETPELIVLDVTLPGIDGFEVCRVLRGFTDAYVLMVTARGTEVDKVVGFGVGADDYVTKPFSARELAARINAMRRRPRATVTSGAARDFGRLRVEPGAREATVDGRPVELTKIEFDLLDVLSGAPRQTFSRRDLLDRVWGGKWFGDDHVIDVHMGNLRRKLGESATRPRHLRTVRGVGYRFDPSP